MPLYGEKSRPTVIPPITTTAIHRVLGYEAVLISRYEEAFETERSGVAIPMISPVSRSVEIFGCIGVLVQAHGDLPQREVISRTVQ